MSVYGGDSWAREAHNRKRRVDELVIERVEASSYKRLSNGKYACLVCPNNPVLDTPTMLSTHVNGSRHKTAQSKRRDKELSVQQDVNKRIASSDCKKPAAAIRNSKRQCKTCAKPLIEQAQIAVSEVLNSPLTQTRGEHVINGSLEDFGSNGSSTKIEVKENSVVEGKWLSDYRERLEMELKFTAAGWKRDCHGKLFRDENVEFDSDEDDPNIVLRDPIDLT